MAAINAVLAAATSVIEHERELLVAPEKRLLLENFTTIKDDEMLGHFARPASTGDLAESIEKAIGNS